MKKKLEAELISIAHRVLKLKNRSETKQLQEEARKLYEQLTILRFYEENFEVLKNEISIEALEAKLENPADSDTLKLETQLEAIVSNQKEEILEKEEISNLVIETEEEPIVKEEETKVPQVALFDDVLIENYKEVDFVKVEDVPKEVEKATEMTFEQIAEPIFESKENAENVIEEVVEKIEPKEIQPEVIFQPKPVVVVEEEPRTMSLNDRLTKGIAFGLNDRIAFEKKLFGGNAEDLNRVLSQLNTFDSFDEARGFINDFVKPDYNNWDGKEEFENRFLEIIERKFN